MIFNALVRRLNISPLDALVVWRAKEKGLVLVFQGEMAWNLPAYKTEILLQIGVK